MSATETAIRVLTWATDRDGPPPSGDLRELGALVTPDAAARQALARAAAHMAARLSLVSPPLGDPEPLGASALWLAAAIGAHRHPAAIDLIKCCEPSPSAWDLIARHAVILPALEHLPPLFAEALVTTSPLTGLLILPPGGQEDQLALLCERLLDHFDGRRLLVHLFCQAESPAPMLSWRGRLLAALRLAARYQPFVLDVYEAAVALHAQAWLARIAEAQRILSGPPAPPARLQLALSIGRWWQPLRAMHRAHLDWLRERRYLDFHIYLQGIKLASMIGHLQGER